MNSKIQLFLDNYTCEFVDGQWQGHFTDTKKLHIVRDNLTNNDWKDIQDEAMCGFWELPNNLRTSLTTKFNRLIEWQISNGFSEFATIPQIMKDTYGTRHYAVVQQMVWGVVTSCMEAIHFNQQNNQDDDFEHDWYEVE